MVENSLSQQHLLLDSNKATSIQNHPHSYSQPEAKKHAY